MKADALIKKAQSRKLQTPAPSPAALKDLQKVIAYNDGTSHMRQRVSAEDAITLLKSHGWTGAGRTALDALCRTHLGRRSYGTP